MFKIIILFLIAGLFTACSLNPQQITAAQDNADLGLAYLKQDDIARAKAKLLLAKQQAPKDPAVLDAFAYFFESTGEAQQADYYYQRAISLKPHNGAVHNNYGDFLCRQGHYQQALQHFNLALQDPDYLYAAAAYENAGLCALKIPSLALAQTHFLQAISHDPTRSIALFELAKLSYNQRRYREARHYLMRYQQVTTQFSQEAQHLAAQLATMPE